MKHLAKRISLAVSILLFLATNAQLQTDTTLYPNGKIKCISNYNDSLREGIHTYYNIKGTKDSIRNYRNGKLHGLYIVYSEYNFAQAEEDYYMAIDNGAPKNSVTKPTTFQEQYYSIKISGAYYNGLKSGKWLTYDEPNSLITEENFKNGMLHGKYISYYDVVPAFGSMPGYPPKGHRKKIEGKYTHGKKDSIWLAYDHYGYIRKSEAYSNNLLNGPSASYYETEALKEIFYNKNNKRDGWYSEYSKNGELLSYGLYRKWKKVNKWNYHKRVKIKESDTRHLSYVESRNNEGHLHGVRTNYYDDGSIKAESMYENGDRVNSKYYEKGEKPPSMKIILEHNFRLLDYIIFELKNK